MGLIVFVILVIVVSFFALLLGCAAEDAARNRPRVEAERGAEERITKFENTPAALYASSKVVQGMCCEIENASRSSSVQKVTTFYAFYIDEKGIYPWLSDDYVREYILPWWQYNFCANRYPNLTNAADRTALARVIKNYARAQLMQHYRQDPSGSNDVKITYREEIYESRTIITLDYCAANSNYVEYKSW